MLEKIFHLLTGYARFEVSGDVPRFLNVAAKSGFGFWGFSKDGEKAAVYCRAGEYKRLRPLARRCKTQVRCVKKGGFPFYLRRLWLRKGLLLGLLCGAALYSFLSGFVWGVSVSGVQSLSEKQVLEAARRHGVYLGAGRDDFAPKLTAHGIISDLPQLEWVTVNTNGCFAEIVVGESTETPEITDDKKWSNIVAGREGTICAIEAEHGRPEVSLGDTVEKGDLLISGLYQEKLDPYSPAPEKPFQSLGAARGRVTAETYREFTVHVSAKRKERVPNGKKKTNACLAVFGLRIPLGLNTVPEELCRQYRSRWTLTALDTPLPLSVEREVYELLEEKERLLTEEEMKEAALLKLREAQKAEIAPGGRIAQEELEYSFPDGMCILTAKCRCREEIGVLQEILVK